VRRQVASPVPADRWPQSGHTGSDRDSAVAGQAQGAFTLEDWPHPAQHSVGFEDVVAPIDELARRDPFGSFHLAHQRRVYVQQLAQLGLGHAELLAQTADLRAEEM
jgi:hypothetical protein